MVGLVEMLLDVLILVSNLGPHFHIFLDTQDAALGNAEVFTEAMVYGTRYANIKRSGTLLGNTYSLVNAATKP